MITMTQGTGLRLGRLLALILIGLSAVALLGCPASASPDPAGHHEATPTTVIAESHGDGSPHIGCPASQDSVQVGAIARFDQPVRPLLIAPVATSAPDFVAAANSSTFGADASGMRARQSGRHLLLQLAVLRT